MKLCDCGCGTPAPVSTRTDTRAGWVKGHPKRYVRGHQDKSGSRNPRYKGGYTRPDGYRMVVVDGRRTSEHRVVMASYLDADLDPRWVVHHKNGQRDDNRIQNLVLYKSQAAHMRYHKLHP